VIRSSKNKELFIGQINLYMSQTIKKIKKQAKTSTNFQNRRFKSKRILKKPNLTINNNYNIKICQKLQF
jgi:hypothetical protein